jgi:hypothetical protein
VDHIVHYEAPAPLEKGPMVPNIPYFRPLCQKCPISGPKKM